MELSSIRVGRKKNEELIDLGQYQSIFHVDTFKQLLLLYLPHLASGGKKILLKDNSSENALRSTLTYNYYIH